MFCSTHHPKLPPQNGKFFETNTNHGDKLGRSTISPHPAIRHYIEFFYVLMQERSGFQKDAKSTKVFDQTYNGNCFTNKQNPNGEQRVISCSVPRRRMKNPSTGIRKKFDHPKRFKKDSSKNSLG